MNYVYKILNILKIASSNEKIKKYNSGHSKKLLIVFVKEKC